MNASPSSRIIGVSFTVIVVVIIGMVGLTLAGVFDAQAVATNTGWSISARSPISYHQVDMDGDGQRELVVEDASGFHILNNDGILRLSRPVAAPFAVAVMNIDGDNTFEIVLYESNADVVLLDGEGSEIGRFSAAAVVGGAGRMRIAGPEQDEIVLADDTGQLAAFTAQGDLLWQADTRAGSLRALVRLPDELGGQVVIGSEDGRVAVFDAQGRELWSTVLPGDLRRLRAFAVDGAGMVFMGGVDGDLKVYDALSGDLRWSASLGQSVDEVRAVELDGDPASTEIAAGGRDGGVWAYSAGGNLLWTGRVAGKVSEIASLNTATYGDVLAVGDETGAVTLFDAAGATVGRADTGGEISLLQNDPRLGNDTLLVGDTGQLQLWQPRMVTSTNYAIPLVIGGVAVVLILAAAFATNRMQLIAAEETQRSERVRVLARSQEELVARWRVLREKARDLEDAHRAGSIDQAAYLNNLRRLRDEMALVSGALEKRGVTPEIRVIECPNCGAPVDTRNDRCEFCGTTLTPYHPG